MPLNNELRDGPYDGGEMTKIRGKWVFDVELDMPTILDLASGAQKT